MTYVTYIQSLKIFSPLNGKLLLNLEVQDTTTILVDSYMCKLGKRKDAHCQFSPLKFLADGLNSQQLIA